jgi:mannose-6-phosphate isomerase-like protein (cupin superfamily)
MLIRDIARQAVFSPDKMGKAELARAGFVYAGLNCFLGGQEHKAHAHAGQDKLYYVVEGLGEATVGDQTYSVAAGDLVVAPADVLHSMRNPGPLPLVVLVILAPPPAAK